MRRINTINVSSHSPLEVLLALGRGAGQVGHRHRHVPLLIEDVPIIIVIIIYYHYYYYHYYS